MRRAARSIARRLASETLTAPRRVITLAAVPESEHIHGEVLEDAEAPETEDEELERAARRLVALSRIRQYGDPVLRMKAREVETYDEDLARLVDRMTHLMHDAQGVGLAATQVGVLRRLFTFVEDGEDRVLVNPAITERSKETTTEEEGCLSLQSVLVPVERSIQVTIEGTDVEGKALHFELHEHTARVVQHELDHLDGVLIIDRTDEASRRAALAKLRPQPVLGNR
jgi:peptide deformylase